MRFLLTVRFSYLAFKQAEVEILCKTLTTEDGKEPVGTFTALDMPAFEDLVSIVIFGKETNTLTQCGRLRRLCDAMRFLKEPVLKPVLASSQNIRCLNYRTQSSSRSSLRGRAGGPGVALDRHRSRPEDRHCVSGRRQLPQASPEL